MEELLTNSDDPKLPVTMMLDFESFSMPVASLSSERFILREFSNVEKDRDAWVDVLLSCGEFDDRGGALIRFDELLVEGLDQLCERIFFVQDTVSKSLVGTIAAWFGKSEDEGRGRIHWLGVRPEFQNNRLGAALLSKALVKLSSEFDSVFLRTSTHNINAIRLYLKFGFYPVKKNSQDSRAWEIVDKKLSQLD